MKKGRKVTGGKYRKSRKKKLYELPGQQILVRLGEEKRKTVRVTGGNKKTFLVKSNVVNVRVNGKTKKVKIENVLETPSNRFLARQNVITKGAILKTEIGKVKVTNRPSQEGMINGVLIEESNS
ncbi:MAG: 30S ribosomal protein S8e [Candidatus Pacearchaeota archaeon]|nr:MAG: 30S ribosomal protein S8e [Candidatus Pacearchaeota archaeon]